MEVKIKAKEKCLHDGVEHYAELDASNVEIEIYDEDKMVAQTTLESLVKKFIIVSAQNMQMAAVLDTINSSTKSDEEAPKIVIPGES